MAANKSLRRLLERIDQLKRQNESLAEQIEDVNNHISAMTYRHDAALNKINRRLKNEQYEREEAELRERYNRYDRETAMKELERARRWGNTWEEEKALKKLKSL